MSLENKADKGGAGHGGDPKALVSKVEAYHIVVKAHEILYSQTTDEGIHSASFGAVGSVWNGLDSGLTREEINQATIIGQHKGNLTRKG